MTDEPEDCPMPGMCVAMDRIAELEAEANRVATLLSQVGGDRRKLDRQLAARQTVVEILGSAIAEVLPEFRASGNPTEHARKTAAALVARVADQRALLSVQDANHGACVERCEQLENEVERLLRDVEDARRDYFEAGGPPSQIDRSRDPEWYRRRTVKLLQRRARRADKAEKLAAKMFVAAMDCNAPMIRAVSGNLSTDELETIAGYVKEHLAT